MSEVRFVRLTLSFALVCLLAAVGPGAAAEILTYVDSNGGVDYVDTENPGEYAMGEGMAFSYGKAGGVVFNVSYEDVNTASGRGFDDPTYGAARRECVGRVIDYLTAALNHSGECDIQFSVSQNDGSGALATGGTFFSSAPGWTNGLAYYHITTGDDFSPSVPDIRSTFDFGYPFYTGTDTPGAGELDLATVLLHELTHGLGFLSLTDDTGASIVTGGETYSYWDDLLVTGNGKDLWAGSPPAFMGLASDLTGGDNGIFFTGTNAAGAFGEQPPVYAPNPWEDGSSIAHWALGGKIAGNAVMEPSIAYGEVVREYAPVEIAALRDLGYDMGQFTFVESPIGGLFVVGDSLSLNVVVSGTLGTVSYQWLKDGAAIVGATETEYAIESLVIDDSGSYKVQVTDDSKGTYESEAAQVQVVEAGAVPTMGVVGLCVVVVICIMLGAFVIVRRGA